MERGHEDGAMRRAGVRNRKEWVMGIRETEEKGRILSEDFFGNNSGNEGNSVDLERRNLIFENRRNNEWLSTKDAAYYLSISENALRIMVHRGQLPVYKLGRRLRFRFQDCQALFTKRGA